MQHTASINKEAAQLRGSLADILRDVAGLDQKNEETVDFLSDIGQVKTRLQTCATTLGEVEKWRRNNSKIEKVFMTRNLQKIADELDGMKHSLSLLDELPDYKAQCARQLHEFQSRLETMATPHLLEALKTHNRERLVELVAVFYKIGRVDELKESYKKSRTDSIDGIIAVYSEKMSNKDKSISVRVVPELLDQFWKDILTLIKREAEVAKEVWPEVENVVTDLIGLVAISVEENLTAWVAEFAKQNLSVALPNIILMFRASHDFVLELTTLPEFCQIGFVECSAAVRRMLGGPFRPHHADYGLLEKQMLFATFDKISTGGTGYDEAQANLKESARVMFAEAREATCRCVQFSSGLQVAGLVGALDVFLSEYVKRLFTMLARLSSECGFEPPERKAANPAQKSSRLAVAPVVREARGSLDTTSSLAPAGSAGLFGDSDNDATEQSDASLPGLEGPFKLLRASYVFKQALIRFDIWGCRELGPAVSSLLKTIELFDQTNLVLLDEKQFTEDHVMATVMSSLVEEGLPSKRHMLQRFVDTFAAAISRGPELNLLVGEENEKPRDDSAHLLSSSFSCFDSFISAIQGLLHDIMFKRIKDIILPLHTWDHLWEATSQASILSVPIFSLQPSEYMTRVGEELLTLLQQLEPYTGRADKTGEGPERESDDELVLHDSRFWINALAKAMIRLLFSRVEQIAKLSSKGGKQLATDVEYINTVVSALGITFDPIVLLVVDIAKAEEGDIFEMLKSAKLMPISESDWTLLKAVAQARGFEKC